MRNLGAPDGLTRSVVLSLGAGLSLLVAVALANASLVEELKERLPAHSPDYFLLDVAPTDYPALTDLIKRDFPGATLEDAPMLRGRIVRLGGRPVEDIKAPPEAQWVLNGDRGLSYAVDVPSGSKVVAGKWWGPDYSGEPLVSFEANLAGKLGVKIGDTVTVNILGRNVTARIANLREVKWESLAINFVMVFSPNTLQGAPYNLLVTIALPRGTPLAAEVRGMRALGRDYPSVTAIRVRDMLDAFNAVFAKVMTAVRTCGRRDAAGRRARARGRTCHGATPAHPRGRHPEDARGDAPAHPPRARARVPPARRRDRALRRRARSGGRRARRHATDEHLVQLFGRRRWRWRSAYRWGSCSSSAAWGPGAC